MLDFTQLETDLGKVASDVKQSLEDLKAVGVDLTQLFAASPADAKAILAKHTAGNTRLQNLLCIGIPIYNMFASANGWPVMPIPAFCAAPAA
jgi:hypothetical protein